MNSIEIARSQAIAGLREAILMQLQNKNNNKLMMALGMGGLEPSFSIQAISDNYDAEKGQLETDIVVKTLIDELRRNFRFSSLLQAHIDLTGITSEEGLQTCNEGAELVFYSKVLGLSYLVKYFDQDVATINQYKAILLAKKRQLAKFSQFGDVDNSSWIAYLQDFSIEKLLSGQTEPMFKDMPEHFRSHLNSVGFGSYSKALIVHCLLDDLNLVRNRQQRLDITSSFDTIETGEDFENYIKELIQENIKDVTVELTPKTGDQGADLIVCGPNAKIAVQAKYFSGKVGNAAVQEGAAAKSYYHADLSIVVTNSEYTDSARRLAAKTDTVLCSIDSFIPHIKLLL